MRARRLPFPELATLTPDELGGAVLLGPVRLPDGTLPKGSRLDHARAARLIAAAGAGAISERYDWPGGILSRDMRFRLPA